MSLPLPDYTLQPYITPYLREIETLLFAHPGHEIHLILDQHQINIGCLTCNEHLFVRPILVYRVPNLSPDDPRELPPTQTTPD